MATVNHGLVAGIKSSTTAPENDRLIWYDENLGIHKRKKAGVWSAFELERASKVVNADYTVTADDFCIIAQPTTADIIITMPSPVTFNAPFAIIRLGSPVWDGTKFYTIKILINFHGVDITITAFHTTGASLWNAIMFGPYTPIAGAKTWGDILSENKTGYIGIYADEADLNTKIQVGVVGWYGLVEDTGTFWYWDGTAWVDTGSSEDIDDTPRTGVETVIQGENNINFPIPFTSVPQRYQVQARDSNGNPIDVRIPPGQIRVNKFKVYASAAGTLFYEFNRV